jgi:hypothetical protein
MTLWAKDVANCARPSAAQPAQVTIANNGSAQSKVLGLSIACSVRDELDQGIRNSLLQINRLDDIAWKEQLDGPIEQNPNFSLQAGKLC